jgi:hypothetical protein
MEGDDDVFTAYSGGNFAVRKLIDVTCKLTI